LKLEIANLRDPMRIDVIARKHLGLTVPLPDQVREYDAPSGMQVAAVRFNKGNGGNNSARQMKRAFRSAIATNGWRESERSGPCEKKKSTSVC